jgi:hypothetical protein
MEPVTMSDKRYDEISGRVRKSYPDACILFIDELSNPFLEDEQSKLGGKEKKFLFHGTSEKNIDSICRNGFRCELNVRSAYGKGTYFSEYASYSINYTSTQKSDDIVYMFLCDVLADSSHTKHAKGTGIYVTEHDYAGIPKFLIAFYPKAK